MQADGFLMLVATISTQDSGFKNISSCLSGCLVQLVCNTKINQCVFKITCIILCGKLKEAAKHM